MDAFCIGTEPVPLLQSSTFFVDLIESLRLIVIGEIPIKFYAASTIAQKRLDVAGGNFSLARAIQRPFWSDKR